MANEPSNKTVAARVAQPRARVDSAGMRSAYCNCFTARLNPDEAVINFGFDERGGAQAAGARQIQVLHKVVLSPATARKLKDTLIALFQKRDAQRVRVKTQVAPTAKSN